MASEAVRFKEKGNQLFGVGDYKGAESLYTQAILREPTNHLLFTNRAFARLKLHSWEEVIDDCLKAIDLSPRNLKAFYYLAEAQLELGHPNEALHSVLTAYEICVETGNTSLSNVSNLVLKIKKEKWERREQARMRDQNELLEELRQKLKSGGETQVMEIRERLDRRELCSSEADEEISSVEESMQRKIDELQSVFAIAYPSNLQRREVPDWIIDNISFAVMHDPVMTKTGQSYDRSTIMEHLRRSKTDPLTREQLAEADLRPNIALKQACEEFLEHNGWAVDY